MRHLATALLIIAAFFVCIEVVGRDRATRWEASLRNIATTGEQLFGTVITFVAAPWRKDRDVPWATRLERWFYVPFLLLSVLSLYLLQRATERFGELPTFAFILGSWAAPFVVLLALGLTLGLLKTVWARGDVFTILLSPILFLAVVGLALVALAASLAAVVTAFPACLIFAVYVAIFLLSMSATRLLAWKEAVGLGNVFIIVGLLMTIAGIVLQWMMSGKAVRP